MRSLCMSLDEVLRPRVALLLGLVMSAVGCADQPAAQMMTAPQASDVAPAPSAARRSNVATPFVTLTPSTIDVLPGAKMLLTAKPGGGEAMRFTVEWQVQEGPAGGSIDVDASRHDDGSYAATYTAPMQGDGPYHVTVRLREYPQADATATVTLVRRRH